MTAPDELRVAVRRAAARSRLGTEAAAAEALVALVDALAAHLARPEGAVLATTLAPLLQDVVAAQTRGDAIGVADLLEHRLGPALAAPPDPT